MSHDMPSSPSAEQIKKAGEDNLSPDQVGLSETRESMLETLKAGSGLDAEKFDEIAGSFETIRDPVNNQNDLYSFKVGGHEIIGSIIFVNKWKVDGVEVDSFNGRALQDKYGKAIGGLEMLNNSRIKNKHLNSIVADLVK